jgi:chromosome segregation ATPase
MSEKYYNYFIEIMTSTMNDAVVRNISLQANSKVLEQIINEQKNKLDELETNVNGSINNLNDQLQSSKSSKQDIINNYETSIAHLKNELNSANALRNEYEAVKSQVQHIDTFRNELIGARQEIENLKSVHQKELEKVKSNYEKQIEKLEMKVASTVIAIPATLTSPNTKNKITKTEVKSTINADLLKDGGSF